VIKHLSARYDAPDPGIEGLHCLGAGLCIGLANETPTRLKLWMVMENQARALGTFDDRPLERAHAVAALVDSPRGRALLPVGDQMMAFELGSGQVAEAWPLPADDGLWQLRIAGTLLLGRGRQLWAWCLKTGALVWSGPEDGVDDWTHTSEGALLGVVRRHEAGQAELVVLDLRSGAIQRRVMLPWVDGALVYVGAVAFMEGSASLLTSRRTRRGDVLTDEALLFRRGRWTSLGAWSARAASDAAYGLVTCAPLDDDWVHVAGRDAHGRRYACVVDVETTSQHTISIGAQTATGGWALSADGVLSHAARDTQWRLTSAPARALSLAPDGRCAQGLVGDRVLGWAW
jgi:hypothetical protein